LSLQFISQEKAESNKRGGVLGSAALASCVGGSGSGDCISSASVYKYIYI